MTRIMIQGTNSSAGKSFVVQQLCRSFAKRGESLYPFKSQNMSSKYIETKEGLIISRPQAIQAYMGGKTPSEYMNPILLIPSSNTGSDLIFLGRKQGHYEAYEYFKLKAKLKKEISKIFKKIAKDQEKIILEGAGSPAEINLLKNDFVNMGMAEIADADVILVGDIELGGVFASLYGTVQLLAPNYRRRIKGLIINKFRGDKRILEPGIEKIEELLEIPVIGVVPYIESDYLDDENLINYFKKESLDPLIEKELDRINSIFEASLDMNFIGNKLGVLNV